MRKKLFILALLLMTGLVPASSNKIVLKWKATFQNGGKRIPSAVLPSALL